MQSPSISDSNNLNTSADKIEASNTAIPNKSLLKKNIEWHRWLGWTGGIALLVFALSGILHPLMSWTGPKAKAFFPPQAAMSVKNATSISDILRKNNISQALMVKVVPSSLMGENTTLLQVTQANDAPRRYFELTSGAEIPEHDKAHAIWLARYYSGLQDTPIKNIDFQTEFSSAYPWVNRLLPVYRISFDTEDHRETYIYTEINALAGITNDYKTNVQTLFRALHTWHWLDDFEHGRVILMMVFLASLFGMALTGTVLVFKIRKRKISSKARRLHRGIAAYAVWLPLLAFTASGTYHLLQSAYGDNHRGLQLNPGIKLTKDLLNQSIAWPSGFDNISLNNISLIEGPDNHLLYRLGIPQGKPHQKVSKVQQFKGIPIEQPAIYLDAITGKTSQHTDRDMAIFFAQKQLGLPEEIISNVKRVTHFGPNYDFRNKRLPVWRIDYHSELGDKLFIDPATGILVDRLVDNERYEAYSFSFLHKWNFLTPLTGRQIRDVIVSVVLVLSIAFTLMGFLMLWRKNSAAKKQPKRHSA